MTASDIDRHLAEAARCQQAGRMADAVRHLDAVLKRNPNHYNALWQRGLAHAAQGHMERAEADLRHAIKTAPTLPQAHNDLGRILAAAGRADAAEACFRTALQRAPGHPLPHIHLGTLLAARGDFDGAEHHLQTAARLAKGDPGVHLMAGDAWERAGQMERAMAAYQSALAANPDLIPAHVALGRLWVHKGDSGPALVHFTRWTELAPDDPEALCQLGNVHVSRWEFDEAEACYHAALKLAPGHPIPVAGLIGALERQRKFDAAWELLQPFLNADNVPPELAGAYATLSRRHGHEEKACQVIEKTVATPGALSESALRALHYQAGDLYDKLGQYGTAFSHYRRANDLNPDRSSSPEGLEGLVDQLIGVFAVDRADALPRATNSDRLPVFILGMPRSGTTLMEQVIASHPQAHGAGELWDITQIVNRLPDTLGGDYPANLKNADPATLEALAQGYLATLRGHGGGAEVVTDKMPHNFMHLGVIDRLFPGARVIHCMRHPVDTCLSCYIQAFSGSGYTSNLDHLGRYYRQYQRLMAHWKQVLTVPILDVAYEDMVADQEGTTRKVLDFIGLPWDDATLAFHKTRRKVATASYDQATRPIYTRSVARWRHYQEHLGPLFTALGFDPAEPDL